MCSKRELIYNPSPSHLDLGKDWRELEVQCLTQGQRGGGVIYVRLAPPGPKGERRGWHPPRLLWRLTSQKRCWKMYNSSWPCGPLLYHIPHTFAPFITYKWKEGTVLQVKLFYETSFSLPRPKKCQQQPRTDTAGLLAFPSRTKYREKKNKISENVQYLNMTSPECDISSRDFSVSRLFSIFWEYRSRSRKFWSRKKVSYRPQKYLV